MTTSAKNSYGRSSLNSSRPSSSATGGRRLHRLTEGKLNRHSIKTVPRKFSTVTSSLVTYSLTRIVTPNWVTSVLLELWTTSPCTPRHTSVRPTTWVLNRLTSRSTTRRATSGLLVASSTRWRPWDLPSRPRTNLLWLWRLRRANSIAYHTAIPTICGTRFKSCFSTTRTSALLLMN